MRKEHRKFYSSPVWRRTRRLVVQRDGGKCRICHRPVTGRGAHVDHVLSVHLRPDLALTMGNLQLLCLACHNRKGRREDGVLGVKPGEIDAKVSQACDVNGLPLDPRHPWA